MSDEKHRDGGEHELRSTALSDEERRRELHAAVRDVEDPETGRLTSEDVETLRDAELEELADIAEQYV